MPIDFSQRDAAPMLFISLNYWCNNGNLQLAESLLDLKLSDSVLADIYLGTITNWNDPAITALNPDLTLPNHGITTVHRSDNSGTTNWFTKYLALVSPTWESQVGSGTSVQWPGSNSIGASGNANVAATVTQTQYAIGYVELAYVLQNGLAVASIQNPAGHFIAPSLASTTAAAQSLHHKRFAFW
jgi:phosphate transport system substrate-binding protein